MSAYRFSCDDGNRKDLDMEELANFFLKNGFLVVDGFFSSREVADMAVATSHFAYNESMEWYRYFNNTTMEGGGKPEILARIEHVRGHIPAFDKTVMNEGIDELLHKIWPEGYFLFKDKINMKLPGQGPDLLHQDVQAGWRKYCKDFLTIAAYIDPCDYENAAISIMKTGRHPRRQVTKDFELLPNAHPPFQPAEDYMMVEGAPGTLILFDAYVPHGSDANRSNRRRRVYFATVNKASDGDNYDQYFIDKLKSYPPNNMRPENKTFVYKA